MLTKLASKGLQYWLSYYLWQQFVPKEKPDPAKPIHCFLCVVDHFEPFNGPVDYQTALQRVLMWEKEYPKFADRHCDAEGKPIQHTWFYPPHLDHRLLPHIVELCQAGYGDIEMHLHHNHMEPFPDTSETLRTKILKCIEDYGKYGIFTQPDGSPRFGFIHGDWSLDNSAGDHICGVNDELTILRECGCYADFTFPCLNCCQPAMANTIFYALDDVSGPKSYNYGLPVEVNKLPPDDALLLIQGIIGLRFEKNKKYWFSIEYSDLDCDNPPTPNRVHYWTKNGLTVKGQPNMRFMKLHTHGAPEIRWNANFGKEADVSFGYLEDNYNDGDNYCLHYVTARELYNIIKVAEKGGDINLSSWRNFHVKRYCYK